MHDPLDIYNQHVTIYCMYILNTKAIDVFKFQPSKTKMNKQSCFQAVNWGAFLFHRQLTADSLSFTQLIRELLCWYGSKLGSLEFGLSWTMCWLKCFNNFACTDIYNGVLGWYKYICFKGTKTIQFLSIKEIIHVVLLQVFPSDVRVTSGSSPWWRSAKSQNISFQRGQSLSAKFSIDEI